MFLALVFLAGLPPQTQSNVDTANSGVGLYQSCRMASQDETSLSANDHVEYASCLMFVTGVTMGFELGSKTRCVPTGTTNTQLALVVYRFLDTHPELLHYSPGVLTIKAIQQAFACSAKR